MGYTRSGRYSSGLRMEGDLVLAGDLLPDGDGTRNLGSSTLEFKDLRIDGEAYIDHLKENMTVEASVTIDGKDIGAMKDSGTWVGGTDGNDVVDDQFYNPNGIDGGTATEADIHFPAPFDLTIISLRVHVETACGGGESHIIDTRVDGADQAVTVTLGNGETEQEDLAHSVSVTKGQEITIQWDRVGGPAQTKASFSMGWERA